MTEIWKDIKGFEGLYQVSSYGNVRSYYRGGRILKPKKDKDGYLEVCLRKNNKSKYFKIHRLVAFVFIENTDNLPQVNHIDENKMNNNINNLEWCDCYYNINYGT